VKELNIEMIMLYLGQYGVYYLFLLVFLEYLKLPVIPSGIVLPATGILLAQGDFKFFPIVIISLIAGICGSLLSYILGYYFGSPILEKACVKSPKIQQVADTAQSYIDRYGDPGLCFIRLVPVARTLVSVIAGSIHIKLLPFMIYSTIGIFIWNVLYMYLGYRIGILFF